MHLELAPPPAQGLGRSLSLALVVHLLLLIALAFGRLRIPGLSADHGRQEQ